MRDQLTGCRAKLARAWQHLEELRAARDEYFGPGPDILPGKFDPDAGTYLFRAQRSISIPLAWSTAAGDAAHNVYAALDYLAWELVAINGQIGRSRTSFPIYTDRARFEKEAAGKMQGIHPDAQRIIESLQPFQVKPSASHSDDHPLAKLYALELRDKHRTLNLTNHIGDISFVGLPTDIHQQLAPSA